MTEEFPPRPGGMIDKARQAAEDVVTDVEDVAAAAVHDPGYESVRVRVDVPDVASSQTIVVSTTGTAVRQILGQDERRYWALVMTLDAPVVLCFNRQDADDSRNAGNGPGQSAGGFVLPVNVPVPLETTSAVWVAATSGTATRVSVIRKSFGA